MNGHKVSGWSTPQAIQQRFIYSQLADSNQCRPDEVTINWTLNSTEQRVQIVIFGF